MTRPAPRDRQRVIEGSHADGTGRGWHRRAAERIAATVRGWA